MRTGFGRKASAGIRPKGCFQVRKGFGQEGPAAKPKGGAVPGGASAPTGSVRWSAKWVAGKPVAHEDWRRTTLKTAQKCNVGEERQPKGGLSFGNGVSAPRPGRCRGFGSSGKRCSRPPLTGDRQEFRLRSGSAGPPPERESLGSNEREEVTARTPRTGRTERLERVGTDGREQPREGDVSAKLPRGFPYGRTPLGGIGELERSACITSAAKRLSPPWSYADSTK